MYGINAACNNTQKYPSKNTQAEPEGGTSNAQIHVVLPQGKIKNS